MASFDFELPALQCMQAGQQYYLIGCPLRLLSRLFPQSDVASPAGHGALGTLNPARVPEITRYITENPRSYTLAALTASVDSAVAFECDAETAPVRCGKLRIPMSAKVVLHDGQHRCAALKAAVSDNPKLGDEAIGIVLFVDPRLRRSEQRFTDLKGHERRLPRSLSILHDDRDECARLTRQLIRKVGVFGDHVELVRTTIPNRSRKMFTLSAIYQATKTLLAQQTDASFSEKLTTATEFWCGVAKQVPEWEQAITGQVSPAELRKRFVHAHGIALAALGRVGQRLLGANPKNWQSQLTALKTLDWSRSNSRLWEGRAMIAGRLSKANTCVVLTANAIKQHLGLTLTPEEHEVEQQFKKRGRA